MIPPYCLGFVLAWEGGYANHPADHGGATNHGITQGTYDAYRVAHCVPVQSVRMIIDAEVNDIFESGYWVPSCACELPPPLALAVFDTAVLWGPGRARRWLQEALGVQADGLVGPVTRAAVVACDPVGVARKLVLIRAAAHHARVAEEPSQSVFLRGWLMRCDALGRTIG